MRWMIDQRSTTYRAASTSEFLVLITLADFVREGEATGRGPRDRPVPVDDRGWTCYPGQTLLIERTGMPKRTLQQNLAKLRHKGFLRSHQRGAASSNLYTLLDPLADARAEMALRRKTAGMLDIAAVGEATDDELIAMADTARRREIDTLNVVRARLGYTGAGEAQVESPIVV